MKLWVIRHAKSSWADPGQADFERPLNGRHCRRCSVLDLCCEGASGLHLTDHSRHFEKSGFDRRIGRVAQQVGTRQRRRRHVVAIDGAVEDL